MLIADAMRTTFTDQWIRDVVAEYQPPPEGLSRGDMVAAVVAGLAATGVVASPELVGVVAELHADAAALAVWAAGAALRGDTSPGVWLPDGGKPPVTDAAVSAASDMAGRMLADVARALIGGHRDGVSADELAQRVGLVVADPHRGTMNASVVVSAAAADAMVNTYEDAGVDWRRWVLTPGDNCGPCIENAEHGPVPRHEPYPSGDTRPPIHPHCRCKLLPVWGGV